MTLRNAMVHVVATMLGSSAAMAADTLRAGAARVDITPFVEEMPPPFKTVYDRTFARALVLDNGVTRAAIVILDVPAVQADIFADLSQQIAKQANVPPANILLSATHTHNSMRVAKDGMGMQIAGSSKYAARVVTMTLDAVRRATAALQPARVGYGAGKAYLNAGRGIYSASQRRYIEGIDRTGTEPVDRTLGVLKFETVTGEPLAFLLNYGVEPVLNMTAASEISGDLPGATSRYIEERFAGKAVVLFTIGTISSPLYRAGPDGIPGHADPEAPHRIMSAMATILGEEALVTAAGITRPSSSVQIGGAMRTLQCPGKITTPLNLPNRCAHSPDSKLPACDFKDKDTDPVSLGMWLLKIGDVALVQADSNVVPKVGQRLQSLAPINHTLIVALNYGPMRYVLDDASYPLNTYEATATIAKQGCAEQGFVDNALQMMEQVQ